MHTILEPERPDARAQAAGMSPRRASSRHRRRLGLVGVSAHDVEPRGVAEPGHRVQQGLEALDGLEPADIEQHGAGRNFEKILGGALGHGLEELGVDTARNDRDAIGSGAVVPDEVRPLDHVGGHDAVRACHDARLLGQPELGLHLESVQGYRVLQSPEGVEHLHERHAPALAKLEPRHAREPVVPVDDVVVDALVPPMLFHAFDELAQVLVDGRAPDGRLRPHGQVDDARAVPKLRHAGNAGILRPREDVHGHPHAAELTRGLAHVHVHAARLLPAEGGKGTRVDAEHGHAQAHGATWTRKRSWGTGPNAYL